jgi:hypothetical protein
MRRRHLGRTGALVAVLSLVAALSGCGNPAGVDGKVIDDWRPVSDPTPFVPAAQVCHAADYREFATLADYDPVDCGQPHRAETIHVGTFTGEAAGRTSPPPKASPELRETYAECDRQAATYLGGDFRHARLRLGVVVPSEAGWSGGARWFRCDLVVVANVESFGEAVDHTGSLKGVLAEPGSRLALGCYPVTADAEGAIDAMTGVPCTSRHNSEFVGVYTAPAGAAYPKADADWQRLHVACRKVVAGYVRLPDDANLQFRTGTAVVPNLEDDWKAGNRGVRCYLYIREATFARSLRAAGPAALPPR